MRIRLSQFLISTGVACAAFLWVSVPARNGRTKDQSQPSAAEFETVYSESPAAWYEAAHNAAQISSDGKWALYHHSFGRGIKLINLETGHEEPERLTTGMDRVSNAAFYMGDQLASLGERADQEGWFLPALTAFGFLPYPRTQGLYGHRMALPWPISG